MKNVCTLMKHTGRWTYSAKDFEIPLGHIPPLRSFFQNSLCYPKFLMITEPTTFGNIYALGCERATCHTEPNFDCKIYNVKFDKLELKYTFNLNAAWGSHDTCNNDGQSFYSTILM